MTQEQKARAYDEALKMAKVAALNGYQNLMEGIFPELCENKDERIRKGLIGFLEDWKEKKSHLWGVNVNDILAWLEKQKSEEINVKALLTADRLAAAEMTGRLKERKDIVENPQKYGLEKQGEKKLENPQSHWKPSQEQMYILEWLTTNVLDNGVVGNKAKEVLYTLIEQLKSL